MLLVTLYVTYLLGSAPFAGNFCTGRCIDKWGADNFLVE